MYSCWPLLSHPASLGILLFPWYLLRWLQGKMSCCIDDSLNLSSSTQSRFIAHEGKYQLGIFTGWLCSPTEVQGPTLIPSMPSSTLDFQSCSGTGEEHRELPVGGFYGPWWKVVHISFAHFEQNTVIWPHLTATRLEMWCGCVLH